MSSNKEDILDMVRLTENEVDIESADVLTCKHCWEMEQLKCYDLTNFLTYALLYTCHSFMTHFLTDTSPFLL